MNIQRIIQCLLILEIKIMRAAAKAFNYKLPEITKEETLETLDTCTIKNFIEEATYETPLLRVTEQEILNLQATIRFMNKFRYEKIQASDDELEQRTLKAKNKAYNIYLEKLHKID